ncbi:MAG: glycosyltransferase family 2 protein [Deltaproteobacteria bacterium]|nr:glycosyltransferase family 2 protein [Deltaproteobacteria bacterium]
MALEISVVIVTHNSHQVLGSCLGCLDNQTISPSQIVIIDSGSDDTNYLSEFLKRDNCTIHFTENIGYAAANNLGLSFVSSSADFVLFINPDTFLDRTFLETAARILKQRPEAAAVTGVLRGYDLEHNKKTGRLDSTGIFRKWYGRWYDRGQGESEGHAYLSEEFIPAICGALMFFRVEAITPELPELFDQVFFMYKEDIDLSIRLRKNGWKLLYTPEAGAFHCRGWQKKRGEIDRKTRLLAARNEIRLYLKHPSLYLIWAATKYLFVRVGNV